MEKSGTEIPKSESKGKKKMCIGKRQGRSGKKEKVLCKLRRPPFVVTAGRADSIKNGGGRQDLL